MLAWAIATKGVLGDACAAGYCERRGMADGGARVPEVLSAAELEGFFTDSVRSEAGAQQSKMPGTQGVFVSE